MDETAETKIARLEERLIASEKALILARAEWVGYISTAIAIAALLVAIFRH